LALGTNSDAVGGAHWSGIAPARPRSLIEPRHGDHWLRHRCVSGAVGGAFAGSAVKSLFGPTFGSL